MSDPSLDLQDEIVGALKGAGIAGGRVYDRVPPTAQFPYLALGPDQVLQDDPGDCGVAYEVFTAVHVWSRTVGKVEAKTIVGDVRDALHQAEFDLEENRLVLFEHVGTRYLTEPDGLTTHAVMDFRALVDGIDVESGGS